MRYTGRTPVKAGDTVVLLIGDDEYEALVDDALATQFTCHIKRKKQTRFYFYEDKGLTWRPVK